MWGATQGWAKSPSLSRQKCQVTFIEERAPLLTEESPKCDAEADEAYWLPLLMWQAEEAPHEEADWLRPREEAGTILDEGDVDLECPLPLEPHLQELLDGEEPSLASAEAGIGLPLMLTTAPLPCKDPEPSPCTPQSGSVAHQAHVDATLVGGAHHNPQP